MPNVPPHERPTKGALFLGIDTKNLLASITKLCKASYRSVSPLKRPHIRARPPSFLNFSNSSSPEIDEMQGADEERTEPYELCTVREHRSPQRRRLRFQAN